MELEKGGEAEGVQGEGIVTTVWTCPHPGMST